MVGNRAAQFLTFITECLPGLVVLLWIDAYLWLLKDGHYKAFLQQKLWPLLLVGISVLLLFLYSFMFRDVGSVSVFRRKEAWIRAAVISLPVVFLYAVYGENLGADALANRTDGLNYMVDVSGFGNRRPLTGDRDLTVLEIVKNLKRLESNRVTTIGSVYRDQNVPEGHFMLFQFAIFCCAADAVPIWVLVKTGGNIDLEDETWVKVEGLLELKVFHEKKIPVIRAERIIPIPDPPPEAQYLFF
jgi:putative membrane protein